MTFITSGGGGMDIHQYRLDNLLRLAARFKSDREFAAVAGINHTYLPQLKAGTKRLGHQLVRRIEINLQLEPGWMDHDHSPRPQLALPPPAAAESPKEAQLRVISTAAGALPDRLREQVARMVVEMSLSCTNERPSHVEPFRFQRQLDLGDTQDRPASAQ